VVRLRAECLSSLFSSIRLPEALHEVVGQVVPMGVKKGDHLSIRANDVPGWVVQFAAQYGVPDSKYVSRLEGSAN